MIQEFTLSPARVVVYEIMQRRAFYYPLVEVAQALGIAQQTAYNQANAGTFPIKNKKMGGRRVVALDDLSDFLSGGLEPVNNIPPLPHPSAETGLVKRRGRPRKVDLLARAVKWD